jgi:hypothetical protein
MDGVKVIGFTGKARSGKDTAAYFAHNFLRSLDDPPTVKIFSMAQTMKHMVDQLFADLDPAVWRSPPDKEDEVPELGVSPRLLYQTLGTDWGRDMIREDLWVIIMRNRIQRQAKNVRRVQGVAGKRGPTPFVLIPDIRYDNEVQLCDHLIQINRTNVPEIRGHKSELGVSPHLIDTTIINNADLLRFRHRVEETIHVLVNRET